MTIKQILAINVKYYRYKMGLSQEKFCNTFNYSRTYINEIENGKRNPSLEWLEQISRNFKISIIELLTYNENHLIKTKELIKKTFRKMFFYCIYVFNFFRIFCSCLDIQT